MKKSLLAFPALFLLSMTSFAERTIPVFVTTQWVADHLHDSDMVLLQVGFTKNEYRHGHIPGARFLWFHSLAPSNPELNTEMPAVREATDVLEQLGVSPHSTIILVFSGQNVSTTTRMLFALSYFGFGEQTALLDGGLERWKTEGRPVSKEDPRIERTSLSLTVVPDLITDAEWVKRNLANPGVTIVDARTRNFFDGHGGGFARQGHIKGARHLAFSSLLDSTNRIKSPAELKKLFDDAGIAKHSTVVAYCHVGQQATVVYCAAKLLGYDAKVYDGSFEEWNGKDESYPVERAESAKK